MDSTKLQNVVDVMTFCEKKQKEKHLEYLNAR